MRQLLVIVFLLAIASPSSAGMSKLSVLELSRATTVLVSSESRSARGSGFIIRDDLVATAFHVVAAISVEGNLVRWALHPDIRVTLPSGAVTEAECVSRPTEQDPAPLIYDFGVLKLKRKITSAPTNVALAGDSETPIVGSYVVFSGYPLATPGMITHKGMVSGFDDAKSLLFLQAPINKGNSGGAVLNAQGQVVGIISMREGGISKGLSDLSEHIEKTAPQGSVRLMGVDPLQATRAIIKTLDLYISTGIGYARSIRFLREYLQKNPIP